MSMIISDVAEAPRAADRQSVARRRWGRAIAIVGSSRRDCGGRVRLPVQHTEGSLGGFTNDQFAHLMRAEMMLRGQQPLRDFADAELRGAWPALSYAVPAWAQQIGGRTLLPEA